MLDAAIVISVTSAMRRSLVADRWSASSVCFLGKVRGRKKVDEIAGEKISRWLTIVSVVDLDFAKQRGE